MVAGVIRLWLPLFSPCECGQFVDLPANHNVSEKHTVMYGQRLVVLTLSRDAVDYYDADTEITYTCRVKDASPVLGEVKVIVRPSKRIKLSIPFFKISFQFFFFLISISLYSLFNLKFLSSKL